MKEEITEAIEYQNRFWNVLRGANRGVVDVKLLRDVESGGYHLPDGNDHTLDREIRKEGSFRNLATVVSTPSSSSCIFARDCDDLAIWTPEKSSLSFTDGMNDFTRYAVDRHKLAILVKLDDDFIRDAGFDFEDYLIGRMAKCFAKAEDNGFLNGSGEDMPVGILHPEKGAATGVTASALTYDDVVKLFFSVKPEYRRRGVWLMNDETALTLRTLKDADGNYLWNHATDTILGKRVEISEYMPNAESGKTPILFGDFRYYWIIRRSYVAVKPLTELFARHGQTGYFATEFLDGMLIRKEAVKTLKIEG